MNIQAHGQNKRKQLNTNMEGLKNALFCVSVRVRLCVCVCVFKTEHTHKHTLFILKKTAQKKRKEMKRRSRA